MHATTQRMRDSRCPFVMVGDAVNICPLIVALVTRDVELGSVNNANANDVNSDRIEVIAAESSLMAA